MNSKIQVLAVDDEFLALNLIESFVAMVPELELIGKTKSPIEALSILNKQHVDLLFVDIQMPSLSGVNLIKTLQQKPLIIFTTAYSDYAVDAFDINAVDYLLKPFSFERFLQGVNKARELLDLKKEIVNIQEPSMNNPGYLVFKADSKLLRIRYDEILFIEGQKEYVRIVCESSRHVTLYALKQLMNDLPKDQFCRVHKSYIVNMQQVDSIEGNRLNLKEHKIPVSRDRKSEVVKKVFNS